MVTAYTVQLSRSFKIRRSNLEVQLVEKDIPDHALHTLRKLQNKPQCKSSSIFRKRKITKGSKEKFVYIYE